MTASTARRGSIVNSLASMAESAAGRSGTSTSARKPSLPRFTPSTGARCPSASRTARSIVPSPPKLTTRSARRASYGELVKPFLLLAIRAEDAAADNEYESFLAFSGLDEHDLRRVRLEQRALGDVDLRDWSGILLGGGPFNFSDPEASKSPVQRRVEADLRGLLERVVDADFPFLGACYGIGTLGRHIRAVVERRYADTVRSDPITLTSEGQRD